MEVYTTENEQVDVIRNFFKENGKAIIIGILIGFGALFGWRYWQGHQTETMARASLSYQQASDALTGGKADGVARMETFIKDNQNSYGVLAAMQLAQHLVDQKDFARAEQQLAWAQGQNKDQNLASLIDMRLARVQMQEKKYDDALKTLDRITAKGWVAMADDVRGDVQVAKGNVQGARDAYSKGLASAEASQSLQALLKMKLNNLSS